MLYSKGYGQQMCKTIICSSLGLVLAKQCSLLVGDVVSDVTSSTACLPLLQRSYQHNAVLE